MTEDNISDREFDFSSADFSRIRELIYKHAGISIAETKVDMVYGRVARRLRAVGLTSFKAYLDELERNNDPEEWQLFTNALTTNLTSFFREQHHFVVLQQYLSSIKGPIRIWCSAASTGEEPYSIAMTACETFGTMTPPVQIIATDIDTQVLETAKRGVYEKQRVESISEARLKKFFLRGSGSNKGLVRVTSELQDLISFGQLNLLAGPWPFKDAFDVIFCRNVLIYFDRPSQHQILDKFKPLMKREGLLFVGHSENFLYSSKAFKSFGKTVYQLNH